VLSLPDALGHSEVEPSTKRTVGTMLFESLRRRGYEACAAWLARHREAIGVRSSVDVAERYQLSHRQGSPVGPSFASG
jgi:hypothetical protein